VIARAGAIHLCSAKELREFADLNIKVRCFVLPQPVATDLLELPANLPGFNAACPQVANGEPFILYLGRLCWIKNLHLLIDAFAQLAHDYPNWHLVLAGPHEDQTLVQSLRQQIQSLGLAERVTLPGMLRDGVKVAALRRAGVFAQPSSHEN